MLEEARAGWREEDAKYAFVIGIGGAADEAGGFGALEQAGDVGRFGHESAGDVALGDAVRAGPGDDAEYVVLRGREAELAEVLLHAVTEHGGGARDVEQDLLLERIEGLALADFFLESRRHGVVQVYGCAGMGIGTAVREIGGCKGFHWLKWIWGRWRRAGWIGHPIECEESMRNRAMERNDVGKIERGEVVVVEDDMSVLCSEDVLRSVLKMAQIARKSPRKK